LAAHSSSNITGRRIQIRLHQREPFAQAGRQIGSGERAVANRHLVRDVEAF
jgi:hypothetical protein